MGSTMIRGEENVSSCEKRDGFPFYRIHYLFMFFFVLFCWLQIVRDLVMIRLMMVCFCCVWVYGWIERSVGLVLFCRSFTFEAGASLSHFMRTYPGHELGFYTPIFLAVSQLLYVIRTFVKIGFGVYSSLSYVTLRAPCSLGLKNWF